MTLQQVLAAARTRLIGAGIPPQQAAVDADVLARAILGWDRARLLARYGEPPPAVLEPRFSEWIARRAAREPTAYITGIREFWGLPLRVTPAVLIPRPETELVVEEALAALQPVAAPRVADIGTGSGCIAVALAHERRDARVVATDVSSGALLVARENALGHGVADRVALAATTYLDGISGPFDLIAANPPYVRERDRAALSRDVRHEPAVALFGGESGLRDIERVLETAAVRLRPGGWLVMEFGFGQEGDLRASVQRHGVLRLDRIRADLQGIPRTAVVQRLGGERT